MPLEPLGASDRTKRIRQKIMAADPLPVGSSASDATDALEGRADRLEDGCCDPPAATYRANYGGIGSNFLVQCVNYYFLGTPTAPEPLPVGTVISITNLTGASVLVTFTLEGPPGFASITIPAGQTSQFTVGSPRVIAVELGVCVNTPPIVYTLFPSV